MAAPAQISLPGPTKATPDPAAILRASEKFRSRKRAQERPLTPRDLAESLEMTEKHWSVAEVADQWGISTDLVRDIFKDEDGVLIVERPGTRTKRSYSTVAPFLNPCWNACTTN